MPEPPAEGAAPMPSRAERRELRTRRGRRRARRQRRRRTEPGGVVPAPTVAADLSEPVTPEPELETKGVPAVADVSSAPAEDPPAEHPAPRRSRRRRKDRRTRKREAAAAALAAEASGPAPEGTRPADPDDTSVGAAAAAPTGSAGADAAPPPLPGVGRAVDAPVDVGLPVLPVEPARSVTQEPGPEAPRVPRTGRTKRRRERRRSGREPRRDARAGSTAPSRRPRRRTSTLTRRALWTRVVPLIALGLGIAVVVGVVARSSDDGAVSGTSARDARTNRPTPMLIVHRGPQGNDLVAVAGRDGPRGSVLLVPVATQLGVPSGGVSTLRDVPVDDGGDTISTAVENLLGVRIGETAVVDDDGLTAALGPAAPMSVSLNDPVDFTDRDTRYQAGTRDVSATEAVELLTAPQSGSELDRLVDVSAVLSGWLDRLRDGGVARATDQAAPALAPFVRVAAASDRRVDTAPVESISTDGGERFNVPAASAEALTRRMFPNARLAAEGRRPRTEILNGTGALGVVEAVAAKIVPAGARLTLADNVPGFGVPTTQVVYYNDAWRGGAQRLLDAMGCGSLRRAGQDVKIADVTIIVGADCPAYGAPGGGT